MYFKVIARQLSDIFETQYSNVQEMLFAVILSAVTAHGYATLPQPSRPLISVPQF